MVKRYSSKEEFKLEKDSISILCENALDKSRDSSILKFSPIKDKEP